MKNILQGSAIDAAQLIRDKEISVIELLEQQFERVDEHNPKLNAIIWQDRDSARALATILDQEVQRGEFRGPLHGVPITVKEAFDLAGSASTWGIPEWKDNIPTVDSEVVQRYREAGAIIFGKTNVPLKLYEWQSFNEIYGTTNNPWDLTRTPGGSSGGSAAALASGLTMLEAGSDIGSSIRNPAHYCGVFGLKPSWGVVPLQGHLPPQWFGDIDIAVTGPMARTALDLDLAFNVLAGADRFHRNAWQADCPLDKRDRISEFRVAVKCGDEVSPVDTSYLNAIADFATKLSSAGATVSDTAAPKINSDEHFDLYLKLLGAAMSADLTEEAISATRESVLALNEPAVERIMLPRLHGAGLRHADWLKLDNQRKLARILFDQFFEEWDILLVPVCATSAFKHDQNGVRHERKLTVNGMAQPEPLQLFWSGYAGVVGLPAIVGPIGTIDGLPVGYQAISGFGRDRTLLAFAKAVEKELGGFTAPPGY